MPPRNDEPRRASVVNPGLTTDSITSLGSPDMVLISKREYDLLMTVQAEVKTLREREAEVLAKAEEKFRQQEQVLRKHVGDLLNQVRGGTADPKTNPEHPGYWLIQLGWNYHGIEGSQDEYGCDWEDPQQQGTGKRTCHTLVVALGIAISRILNRPNAFQRLDDLDDDV